MPGRYPTEARPPQRVPLRLAGFFCARKPSQPRGARGTRGKAETERGCNPHTANTVLPVLQIRETLLFLSSQYSLSHRPKRGSPSILTIECVLADERLRLLTRIQRAWSYFLPRLGPGPISTRDSEIILPVPNSHHVVPGTLARPRQIVTMIVIRWHKFMPPTPFLLGRSPQN